MIEWHFCCQRFTDDTPQRDKYQKPDSEISSLKKIDYQIGVKRPPHHISLEKPRFYTLYTRHLFLVLSTSNSSSYNS